MRNIIVLLTATLILTATSYANAQESKKGAEAAGYLFPGEVIFWTTDLFESGKGSFFWIEDGVETQIGWCGYSRRGFKEGHLPNGPEMVQKYCMKVVEGHHQGYLKNGEGEKSKTFSFTVDKNGRVRFE